MSSRLDELLKAEQVQDMLRDAERRGLVRRALATRRPPAMRFYSPALARLGRWLELWGCRLQTRYGAIAEVGVVTRVGDGRSGCS
ncbi:MAG: hypothetical protein ACJ8CR_38205 [Roseiflexaceae bacterium]